MNHQARAQELFQQGYNCSQSVFAAFSDDLGLDFETALKLTSSLGGGMARLREVCGAVTAMFLAAGMKYGYSDPKDGKAKAEHYTLIQNLAKQFEKENGSLLCRDLLGLTQKRDSPVPEEGEGGTHHAGPCAGCVACAARMLDDLFENGRPKM
ncbi:MAG: C-GCAxxG-C-C family protein [Oscillospiraceae bacterium]|jgi:C_GCAxxG_C_C family probable redox protein|nr:C-GCAxxG-C-C family protein [Oscillospiraceae bacterium]